ncbi:MAG: M20/M25/M40 family metallo-hydrolase, partial [Planctomycetales bacterium]|nr:M20/M25/M40 family metallo-hydrolase [Planctomycetales bacterium]
RIEVSPNKYGILPDRAEITVDVRHPNPRLAKEIYDKTLALLPVATEKSNVAVRVAKEWNFGDIKFDPELIDLIRSVAVDLKVSHRDLLSAAGHDAYHVSSVIPTAMIFTPCEDGITHNENENIEPEYTVPGVNVLLNSVLRRANR